METSINLIVVLRHFYMNVTLLKSTQDGCQNTPFQIAGKKNAFQRKLLARIADQLHTGTKTIIDSKYYIDDKIVSFGMQTTRINFSYMDAKMKKDLIIYTDLLESIWILILI